MSETLLLSVFTGSLTLYRVKKYWEQASRTEVFEPPDTVCVQVFSRNEEEVIGYCLESLLSQEILKAYPDKFKLQVFDSSEDRTPDIAESYGFKVYELPRGKLLARNFSVLHFPECWVHVHVDADTVFPPNWLGNTLSHFLDPEVVAVTSPRVYIYPLPIRYVMIYWRGVLGINERIYGSNCAVRHDVFELNLFDESYEGRPDMVKEEEYMFYQRLRQYGKVVLEPTPAYTRTPTQKYLFRESDINKPKYIIV